MSRYRLWCNVLVAMDSQIVSRELWKAVRPLLKDAAWSAFSSRTARRFSGPRIDVVNFQSFNSYLASAIGSTTYSFSIRLGCFFTAIAEPYSRIKVRDGLLMPEEGQCHLRYTIHKQLSQPECPRTDVFYVDPEGKYLPIVVEAVRRAIATEGLLWFQRFSEMQEVLRTLMEDDSNVNEGTWGFGAKPSPRRNLYTGCIALSLGQTQIAMDHLRQAGLWPEEIEAILSKLK